MKILLTGATGFVGNALLPRLLAEGFEVRCLVRSESSREALGRFNVECVDGDAEDQPSLNAAMQGCDLAYYLIHSMDGSGSFVERDRRCAHHFRNAAEQAGLGGMIYLSGLANEDQDDLSKHLASRLEVGRIFRSGSVPCIEFKAAMVIGEGSISFRMVEHLCQRLPIMLCPKWLSTETQPIAIDDLTTYLCQAIPLVQSESRAIEIGGADRTTYMKILKEYCRQKGLTRVMIPVPVLSPKLSSHWLGLVTPETAAVGKAMIDGLRNPTCVQSPLADELFDFQPMTIAEAISKAIETASDPSPGTSGPRSHSPPNTERPTASPQ